MDYDIRAERLEEAVALTPRDRVPHDRPLHREGWLAVRAMVPRDAAQRIMDQLWTLGARGTLITDILSCRI
jgi:ATP phosphoribosyltransferase